MNITMLQRQRRWQRHNNSTAQHKSSAPALRATTHTMALCERRSHRPAAIGGQPLPKEGRSPSLGRLVGEAAVVALQRCEIPTRFFMLQLPRPIPMPGLSVRRPMRGRPRRSAAQGVSVVRTMMAHSTFIVSRMMMTAIPMPKAAAAAERLQRRSGGAFWLHRWHRRPSLTTPPRCRHQSERLRTRFPRALLFSLSQPPRPAVSDVRGTGRCWNTITSSATSSLRSLPLLLKNSDRRLSTAAKRRVRCVQHPSWPPRPPPPAATAHQSLFVTQ